LRERADDVKTVIDLRSNKNLEAVTKKLKERSDAKSKDVRFRAWYAEALLATGAKDEARTILAELQTNDLMPDAYAIQALAVLSSGEERYELWKQCRARAKNKDICELPDAKVTRK
jgi:thioredoxin-like negative regulator of GroEL